MSVTGKALVLGSTGLLGTALVNILQKNDWSVFSVGGSKDIDFYSSDSAQKLEQLINDIDPSVIFNTVAYTQVDLAEEDEEQAATLNRGVPALLGRIVKAKEHCHLVHYSTDFVFNGKKHHPYTEEDLTAPLSVYGQTKLAGEEALLALELPKCSIIRTAWLFGPGRKNFITGILELAKKNETLNVVHDQVGSPTYSIDLAKYSLQLVQTSDVGLYHIVNSGTASKCDLATEAVRIAQVECQVLAVPSSSYPQKAQRPAYSVLSTEQFTKKTGITPRPWAQALCEYVFSEETPIGE